MFVSRGRWLRLLYSALGGGMLLLLGLWLAQPEPCYACASQTPPPTCSTNMSAMTMRQADDPQPWWNFAANMVDQREPQTIRIYLGINMNGGVSEVPYSYEINASGDWLPSMAFPITGTGVLSPRVRNQTVLIELPYTENDVGALNLTANVIATDANNPCDFTPNPATSQVQLNPTGPTVWPITSRACPLPGEKQVFRFGVRNPSNSEQNYSVAAQAITHFGGEHTPILNENQGDPGTAQLPMLTLKPNESQQIEISCETFGFCLTGSESSVALDVQPVPGGAEDFPGASAVSNITLRDPDTTCVAPEDWWSILSPFLLGLMIGVPLLMAAIGGGGLWYANRSKPRQPPPPEPPQSGRKTEPRPIRNNEKGVTIRDPNNPNPDGTGSSSMD